jgi:hypothetical protein
MIGDSKASGKRHSTKEHGPEFKKKNSEGRSYKHVDGDRKSDGGGGRETKHAARRAHKTGPRPGVNGPDRQAPHKQKERIENKHVDQGQILDEWCRGKRGCYK